MSLFKSYERNKKSGLINTPKEFAESRQLTMKELRSALSKELPNQKLLTEIQLELLPKGSVAALMKHNEKFDKDLEYPGFFKNERPDDLEEYDKNNKFTGYRNPSYKGKIFKKKSSGKGLHPQGLAKGGRIIKRKGGGQIGKPRGWGAARHANN
jgi:hypothetical protein